MGRGLRDEAWRVYGWEVGSDQDVLEKALEWGVHPTLKRSQGSEPEAGEGGKKRERRERRRLEAEQEEG